MLNWFDRFRKKFQFNYFHMLCFLVLGHFYGKKSKKSFKGFSQVEIDFYDFKLMPIIEMFEQERKKILNWFRIKFFIWLILIIIIANISLLIFAILFALISYPVVIWHLKKYKGALKGRLIPAILEYFEGKFAYENSADSVDFNRWYSYGIMPKFNKLRAEDYILGVQNNIQIELAELNLSMVTIHASNRPNVPDTKHEDAVFHGLCVVLTFNKKFDHRIVAVPKGEYLGNSEVFSDEKLQRVKLEDPRFEAVFDLYGSDQVEARYVFTPTFMERLVALQSELNGTELRCSFYNDKLQILIPTNYDHFRVSSIFKEIDFVDEFRMILKEMSHINKIIDVLRLNRIY